VRADVRRVKSLRLNLRERGEYNGVPFLRRIQRNVRLDNNNFKTIVIEI
jgi:hypothetical protein